jgi:hypothetical protein
MKKVLAIVAIASFAACGNGETKAPAVDSAKIKDSIAKAEAAAKDTTKKADTTKPATVDTTKK